jgi:glycine oxidase
MGEASWAAAGMLAAHDPDNPLVLRPMSELSLKLYPHFLDELERLSGERVCLRTRQTIQGTAKGKTFSEEERSNGKPLSSAEAAALAPGIITANREFILLEENSLDPREICSALPKAALAAGVKIYEQTAVLGIETTQDGIRIATNTGVFSGKAFVNCCGAWAGEIFSENTGVRVDQMGIEPRKGQIVTLAKPELANLSLVLRTPETYLVPRCDGRVLIGATVERAGFNKEVNDTATQALIEEAQSLYSPLKGAEVVETWAGLRPGSGDGLPLMGAIGPRQWIAAGHFRNGILLAPATGHLMSKLLQGQPCEVSLDAFRLERFSTVPA